MNFTDTNIKKNYIVDNHWLVKNEVLRDIFG